MSGARARRLRALGRCLLGAAVLWAGGAEVRGEPSGSAATAARLPSRIRRLIKKGTAALSAQDFPAAYAFFAEAYRKQPRPETMFLLGELAAAEGRITDAHDLMRRFIADPSLDAAPDAPELARAQQVLAMPRPAGGKLNLIGDRGTLVSVDGRLVGALPLARSLLLTTGPHCVRLEGDEQAVEESVQVPVGRLAELRYTQAAGAVLLSLLPGVVVLDELSGTTDATRDLLVKAIEDGVQGEHMSPVMRAAALELAEAPELSDCLDQTGCRKRLAHACQSELVLSVQALLSPGGFRLKLEVMDVPVGDVAASAERTCPGCTAEQAASALATLVPALLFEARNRPRGAIEVKSEPPGAEVFTGARLLGRTPLRHPAWTGPIELSVRKERFEAQRHRLYVLDAETDALRVELLPDLPEPAPPMLYVPVIRFERPPRPRWRLLTGGLALGGGLLLLGFGGALTEGSLGDGPSPGAGGGLIAGGLSVVLGGALLLGLPARREAVVSYTRSHQPLPPLVD